MKGENKVQGCEGQCRCGQVRFAVSARPMITMACHCQGCQRMTAGPYSLSALYPAEAFRLLQGEPVIGGMHGTTRHYFCGHCMSWLYTKPEGLDGLVNVRSSMLENVEDLQPFIQTCTAEKLSWIALQTEHSYTGFPPMEAFPELLTAYAAQQGEP